MLIAIKIALIVSLAFVLIQDLKERQVYWFLFPITAILCGILHYHSTLPELFYTAVILNLSFTSLLLLIVFLYAKFKLKTGFSQVFGLGDVFLFIALAFSFSTVSFVVLFISALVFALLLHLSLNKKTTTVPLAGYLSLFFGVVYMAYWFEIIHSLYSI